VERDPGGAGALADLGDLDAPDDEVATVAGVDGDAG
jgi:hypothetical protein